MIHSRVPNLPLDNSCGPVDSLWTNDQRRAHHEGVVVDYKPEPVDILNDRKSDIPDPLASIDMLELDTARRLFERYRSETQRYLATQDFKNVNKANKILIRLSRRMLHLSQIEASEVRMYHQRSSETWAS